jgi:hypothetical protein
MEYYKGEKNIARLNSGRAAIWHAFRVLECDVLWIPYYQCDTVRKFLYRKKVIVKYYHIDSEFNPIDLNPQDGEAVLLVNYYGIMSHKHMEALASKYRNVIIDNSQALFNAPIDDCMNIYSTRKFVGVPDGAYVIGRDAEKYISEYEQCYSSDTALFLLQRIEYGCEGKTYQTRSLNEHRIDSEDIMRMSELTRTILDGTDYDVIRNKRKENFDYACELFKEVNKINPKIYYDEKIVPMVYPLVVEDDGLLKRLLDAKHFQGHWWSYILDEVDEGLFEYWISRYVIPITIDQRYEKKQLDDLKKIIY